MVCALVSVIRKLPVLERAREVFLNRLHRAVIVVLRSVIDVVGGNVERRGDRFFVHVVPHHAAEVGGDELAARRRTRAPAPACQCRKSVTRIWLQRVHSSL